MTTVKSILIVKGSNVIVLAPTTTVLNAATLMAEVNVGCVVVGNDDEVLGVFTERDLLRRVVAAGRAPSDVLLCDVMSYPIKYCNLGDDVRKCAKLFSKSHVRHLAVVGEGVLIGLIGLRDILTAELRSRQKRLKVLQSSTQQNSMELAGTSKNVRP